LLPLLRCPGCRANGALGLEVGSETAREVREGALLCGSCGARFEVAEGIVDLLPDPPEFVRRESEGLQRFAQVMRADGWDRERILALPDVDLPYWHGQATAMRELRARMSPRAGARLLDVGSNTCWASNIFARDGLEVIALDISAAELQGLRTAEHFLASDQVYFERLLSVMFDPALADESVDYVFCCEVLHHNAPAELSATFREMHRILRAGGTLMVVNEPLRFPLRLKRDHGVEVADFEGNEHVYFLHQYVLAARRAGFRVSLRALECAAGESRSRSLARFVWRYLVRGDRSLTMTCTKRA
jgi:SAM-dependent methyltransferase/uncharacterized protein YbaR (Trm112 family)